MIGTAKRAIVSRLRAAGSVFAEDEAQILIDAAATPAALAAMVDQRVAGLPLESIVGWADFCGQRVAVDPGVFVPRRRTELLVRTAVAFTAPGMTVVDLACGTGAVGLVIASRIAGVSLHAVDIDPAAVACARRNLEPVGGRVYAGDLYDALPPGLRAGVVVANVPYVPTDALDLLPREARMHERRVALDGGADGLDLVRRVAGGARDRLAPGGRVLVEAGADQVDAAVEAFAAAGLAPTVARDDEVAGTVVVGEALR